MKTILLLLSSILFSLASPLQAFSSESRAIAFDFGGVMANANKIPIYDFIKKTFLLDDQALEEVHQRYIEAKKAKCSATFWKTLAAERGIDLDDSWERQFEAVIFHNIEEIPGMRGLVNFYSQQGIPVALLSNEHEHHAAFLRAGGYYEGFSPVLLSCEIGVDKPDPQAYKILLEQLKIAPQNCIFVDDKTENVNAAKAMGIDAILFLNFEQIRRELAQRFDKNL